LMLPGERIKAELDQVLLSPQPAVGITSLYELGLLLTLIPELTKLEALNQSEHHHLDVLGHILLMIEKIPGAIEWLSRKGWKGILSEESRLSLFYAALFHDIGKQDTFSADEKGKVHFYHHQFHSCRKAAGIMERLRFSNAMRDKVLRVVENHMRILNLSGDTKETALKRVVHRIGKETPLLVLHTLADKEASRGMLSAQVNEVAEDHCLRILELFQQNHVVHPSPLIKGEDVMALGYSPGPKVGKILNFIMQKQIDGEINTREEALRVLKEKF
jgi:tRNA nucleotidyltransferase (CCA-adding enzyme)